MTLYEALEICGNNYNQYIQITWSRGRLDGKTSGIMKKGKITYRKLDEYGYGYKVWHIFASNKQGKDILFIQMIDNS